MYKYDRNHQFKLLYFNQPIGLKMNPDNRWVKKAATILWNEIEEKYAALFPGKKGMPAKPLRTAMGSPFIQKQYEYSDRELVKQIRENPYYQFSSDFPDIRMKSHLFHHFWWSSGNILRMTSLEISMR